MKKLLFYFLLILIIFDIQSVSASDTSKSTIVMDMDSGRILYEKNKDEKRLIASITKIMTAVIAIENKNLDSVVTIGEEVLPMYGSNIYIEVGEKMTLRDLLYGLMLRSGNDAAVAIANFVSKDEESFVKLMNEKAKKLGMYNTIFRNPHGLDEKTENYSTAYDMAKLMSYANKLLEFVEISGTKEWKVTTNKKTYLWRNRNSLLFNYKYLTGGKTGYTPRVGKTLVTTASKDNLNLVAVTLSDGNHYSTQKELYEYLFSKYKSVLIIDKNNISFDKENSYDDLYLNYSFSYPLKEGEFERIKVYVDIFNLENYVNNEKVGEIYVMFDNTEIYRENIYAIKYDKKDNNIFNKIKNFFNSLF